MTTNAMKSLKLISLGALLLAGCDPFTKTATGTPQVIHALASDGNNIEEATSLTNQNAIVVDDIQVGTTFYVWFNVGLDGNTVQAAPDIDPATGKAPVDPVSHQPIDSTGVTACPLAIKTFTPAGSATAGPLPSGTGVAYQPGSATDGGIIFVNPRPVGEDFFNVGAYAIGGTVKDTAGNPGSFKVTFNVTHHPTVVPRDGYTVDVAFANDPRATGFTVESTTTATPDDAPGTTATWTANGTGVAWVPPGSVSESETGVFQAIGLTPVLTATDTTTYWFRVTPEGIVGAQPSTVTQVPNTPSRNRPGVKGVANPATTLAVGGAASTVQLTFARILQADYRVQTAPFTTGTPAWVDATGLYDGIVNATTYTNPIPADDTVVVWAVNVPNLAVGTGVTHLFRVVPEWGGVAGTPTKTATVALKR